MTSPTRPIEDPVQRPLIAPAVHHHQPAAVPSIPPHVPSSGGKPVRRLGLIVDENSLDIPAFKRRNVEAHRGGPTRLSSNDAIETEDKLEIPAFLRKPVD